MRNYFVLLFVLIGFSAFSQYEPNNDPDWSLLMTDPEVDVNEVIELFNQHWEGREITPGCGYKPFKRWEHLMFGRVDPDGKQLSPAAIRREFESALAMKQERSENGNWQNLGPILDDQTSRVNIPGVGRINHVAFHPTDPNIIFCGAPAGGVWRSYDGGNNWVSNTDDLPTLGVSAIAFDHFNPDIVYIGTGDRDAGDAPGMGVMRSNDGGLSWEFVNQGMENDIVGDVITDPENPGHVLAGTRFGVKRSTDYGETWELVSNTMYYKQLLYKPGNSQIVYATAQGRFFKSIDNGATFNTITDGLSNGSRYVIAVSPADPERVYVCSANLYDFRALYMSNDSGESFTEMSNSPNILGWSASGEAPGGQAWFDLCMTADPLNADRIFVGGIRMKRSDDGGATWLDIQNTFLHVDQHWTAFNPHDGQLYLCNDGGIYRYEIQNQWVDISHGIISGQIYKFGQAPITANKAMSGYQDNGTMEFNGVSWQRTGGADGFECQYDPLEETTYYNSIYYGQVYRTNGQVTNQKICGNEELGIDEEGAWSSPWFVTQQNPNKMFVGLKNVWRAANIKTPEKDDIVWERISFDIGSNNTNIPNLAQSQVDTNIVYASKANRQFYRTDNANAPADEVEWVTLNNNLPFVQTPVTAIGTHPTDSNTVYIGYNNQVHKSSNRGVSWEIISATIPDVRINSIVFDLFDDEGIYVGTDQGVYYRNAQMDDFVSFSNGLPLGVRVTELEIFYGSNNQSSRLRASTYGRGMWESDLYGAETIPFPATAWLNSENNTTEVFDTFEITAGFYRHLNNVEVTGFEAEDITVFNGSLTGFETGPGASYSLTIEPEGSGIVSIVVQGEAAIDAEGVATYPSDTLRVLRIDPPDPFGYEGPGGIGNIDEIEIWLKADEGVLAQSGGNAVNLNNEPVGAWKDAIGHERFAIQEEVEMRPILQTGEDGINGFPAIGFNGENNALVSDALPSSVDLSVFSVARGADGQWNEHGWIASARVPNGFLIHPWRNTSLLNVSVLDNEESYASSGHEWIVDAGETQLYGIIYGYHPEAQLLQKVVNGTVFKYPSSTHGERVANAPVSVRYGWDFDERYGEGQIAEHVIYNRRLFESHRIILSNYLGVKYGMDIAPELRYNRYDMPHDIAGIGRVSQFDKHEDAKGSGPIRMLNPSDLDNNEFLIWGHNGASVTWVSDGYPIVSPNINRVWAFNQTGDVGATEVRIYLDELNDFEGEIGLIISDDEQFLPGSTPDFIPLTDMGDYYVANASFPSSGVFTIGAEPVVGIENLSRTEVKVFPNPAGEAVTVQVDGVELDETVLRMFDPSGRQVMQIRMDRRSQTIDLSRLAPGMYTISVEKGGQRTIARVVHY